MVRNPLFEQPRFQPAPVIPSKHESSLLGWLESSGRLMARNTRQEPEYLEEGDLEISGLMDTEEIADDLDDIVIDEDVDLDE